MSVTPTDLSTAQVRLTEYRRAYGLGPHRASTLSSVIWPDGQWRSQQGAGAAATRVLKKLGCHWTSTARNWGWMLSFTDSEKPRDKAEQAAMLAEEEHFKR